MKELSLTNLKPSDKNTLIATGMSVLVSYFVVYYLGIGKLFTQNKGYIFLIFLFVTIVCIGTYSNQLNKAEYFRQKIDKK